MPVLNAAHVASVAGGRVVGDGDVTASRLVADSRAATRDTAFAAVRGGHAYIEEAVRDGAPWVLVEEGTPVPPGATAVVVGDTVVALGAIATDVRSQQTVRVVGITGSTGKTLTKDFVGAVLRTRFRVHAAPSSYNNEIGVPLVVLGCPDDADVIVAELGARRPGEIASLCAICRPHIGVLTGVGSTHLELFGTRASIARTKSELLEALPGDGAGVVPSGDDFLSLFARSSDAQLVTVGPGGTIGYSADVLDASGRTHGHVIADGDHVAVTLPIPGRALMRNAAMAVAVGAELGIPLDEGCAALAHAATSDWRMEIVPIDGRTIVNDAYNANPTSMAAALRTVRELAGARPCWAVLGEMAELGSIAAAAHARIGRLAVALGYETVVAVGEASRRIAGGAGSAGVHVADADEAADAIVAGAPRDALVLVKGSRVTALDRFPDVLRQHLRPTAGKV